MTHPKTRSIPVTRKHLFPSTAIALSLAAILTMLIPACSEEDTRNAWTIHSRLTEYLAANESNLKVTTVRFGEAARPRSGIADHYELSVIQPLPEKVVWKLAIPNGNSGLGFDLGYKCSKDMIPGRVDISIDVTSNRSNEKLYTNSFWIHPREQNFVYYREFAYLDRFAGKEVTLTFSSSTDDKHLEGAEIVWGNPVILAEQQTRLPNIILICIDALRRDKVAVYAPEINTTPVLQMLAQDGVVFENAITQSPWTLPSVSSVLTGLYPSIHVGGKRVLLGTGLSQEEIEELRKEKGLVIRQGTRVYGITQLRKQVTTIPEIIGGQYVTHMVNGNAFLSENVNIINRFQSFDDHALHGRVLTRNCVNWLKDNSGKLFFLYAHYMEPHEWIRHYQERYPEADDVSRFDRRLAHQVYDELVEQADQYVGRLIDTLKQLGIYDSTMIIVYSDHGELLWDDRSGLVGHGNTLRRALLEVPLIVKFPNSEFAGARISAPAKLVDIFRTIVEEAGIPLDSAAYSRSASLRRLADGSFKGTNREIISEFMLFGGERVAIQQGSYRLTYEVESGETALFDAGTDKRIDLSESKEAEQAAARLEQTLKSYFKLAEKASKNLKLIEADEAERERLRQLGYLK